MADGEGDGSGLAVVVSATTGARVVPLPPPDPRARTVFYLCQTADAAYHESPFQNLGEGVIAEVWWAHVLTAAEREGIEAPWVRKYGRDEGLSYAWRDYPGDAGAPPD